MTKEELTRNLKYTEEKHRNDKVNTFDTNISDVLKVLENCIEIPNGATNGDMIKTMFPNIEIEGIGGEIKCIATQNGTSYFALDWWNAPYKKWQQLRECKFTAEEIGIYNIIIQGQNLVD